MTREYGFLERKTNMESPLKKELQYYLDMGKEWKALSCVSRNYPPSFSHKLRSIHGGIKPPELCIELISGFANNSTNILDPFAGAGSSLIAASILNKKATGIDINSLWSDIYHKVCQENNILTQKFLIGDSEHVLKKLSDSKFDLVLTDVPYFNMDKLPKTRGKFSRAGEKSLEKLHSSLNKFNSEEYKSKSQWINKLTNVFNNIIPITKESSLFIIFIGNMYRNFEKSKNSSKKIGKYLSLSSELSYSLKKLGLKMIKEIVWIDPGKKLGIYGYPYVFIPSILDQRILIFQK
ncbi:MAG: tRNA (guanine(10)-N2)-dimethyltransferase [Candidatus Heimdallarchaeota archaeon LC_3]|nr:MAG: tRNA (guanine(10)-N2)-dimethyltransferase [Candidatus Heimdallarchaeota archaeon LC_3]